MLFKYHIKSILPSDPKLDFFTTHSESVSQTTEKGKAQSLTAKTQADKNYCSGRLEVGWGSCSIQADFLGANPPLHSLSPGLSTLQDHFYPALGILFCHLPGPCSRARPVSIRIPGEEGDLLKLGGQGPIPRVSDSASLGGAREPISLTSSQVVWMLWVSGHPL